MKRILADSLDRLKQKIRKFKQRKILRFSAALPKTRVNFARVHSREFGICVSIIATVLDIFFFKQFRVRCENAADVGALRLFLDECALQLGEEFFLSEVKLRQISENPIDLRSSEVFVGKSRLPVTLNKSDYSLVTGTTQPSREQTRRI